MSKNLELISQVIIRTIETADSWKNKKVSKTISVASLFTKAAKTLTLKGSDENNSTEVLRTQGSLIVKAIEEECIRDKAMSNLKGKITEIKKIVSDI